MKKQSISQRLFAMMSSSYINTSTMAMLILASMLPNLSNAQVTLTAPQKISKATDGSPLDSDSDIPALSGNGRYMAFESDATNLILNDQNSHRDIFLKDLKTGSLTRLSFANDGGETSDFSSNPSISNVGPDGFFGVAYRSVARNIASVTTQNEINHIYVNIPKLGKNFLISANKNYTENSGLGNNSSFTPSIAALSAPNRLLVTYSSRATNLTSISNPNTLNQILLTTFIAPSSKNKNLGEIASTIHVSKNSLNEAANSNCENPEISGDGNYVVFSSDASNLSSENTNSISQIFLYDVAKNQLSLISKDTAGNAGDFSSSNPHISFSGRFVTFSTLANNLVGPSDTTRIKLVVLDRTTGTLSQINTNSEGIPGNGDGQEARISPNGRFVVFNDQSSNLVENDNNSYDDIFLKDRLTGEIKRVSINSSGGELDGSSDKSFISGESFNALKGLLSFRTFAQDVTSEPSNGDGELYTLSFSVPKPELTSDTKIEAPADVINPRRKIIRVNMQSYTLPNSSPALEATLEAKKKRQVIYDTRLEDKKRKANRQRNVGNRNKTTFRNVKPGTYSVRYRVMVKNGSKTQSTTPFSPRQEFQVR